MTKGIKLINVDFFPETFSPAVLYISEEYKVAGHLCACGCGSQVITPLGPAEWCFTEVEGKPSLEPSIGNWQLPCKSHYWITAGRIEWSYGWTEKQIKQGELVEEEQRQLYYAKREKRTKWYFVLQRVFQWFFPR